MSAARQGRRGGRGGSLEETAAGQVLLLGAYRPAVTAARALARRGRRVVVGRDPDEPRLEGSAGVEFSRYVAGTWDHPSAHADPDRFVAAVAGEVARHSGTVHVLPLFEAHVALLSRARAQLPANGCLAAPPAEVVATCLDKEVCLDAAQAAGLPMLPREVVRGHAELLAAAARMGGAVVVKPLAPHTRVLGRKALLCGDARALALQVPEWPAGHDRLLLQRLARGPRHVLHFAARDGEILGCVEVLVIRTDRHDDTGLVVEGRTRPTSPALVAQLARLLAHLRYTGVGCGQFLVEPGSDDGAFIEVNPRPGAAYTVADRAGLDLANLAIDLAAGEPMDRPVMSPQPKGITYAWTFGDLVGLRNAVKEGIAPAEAAAWFGRIVRNGLRADVHATWSWRDPLPTLVTYWRRMAAPVLRGIVARRRPVPRPRT